MNKFNKIVGVDRLGLQPWALDKLNDICNGEVLVYDDFPSSEEEIIARIADADAVLVSWNTKLSKQIIEACPNIKYIGMCCSLYDEKSANVDIAFAKTRNISVKGIRDYGDEGTIEYIISELIGLCKGTGKYLWKDEPVELTRQKIGIIGLGATGTMLAKRAMAFNMDVYYYSRTPKAEIEAQGVKYLPLNELLSTCDIISTHLPKNTILIDNEAFKSLANGKILINTSLSYTFDKQSFDEWISNKNNYAIFDGGIGALHKKFINVDRVISTSIVSGWTKEAKVRLSQKVLDNITSYLD